ncbi:MAG: hypothetical protein ABR518_10100 [Actinomycetota bacterium]
MPLLVAGSLALLGTAIHGVVGEFLVVRRLSPRMLPSSRFGGPGMTMAMIRASWHLTTIGFLTVGTTLIVAGSVVHGETARAIAFVAAGASSGFAAVVLGGALAQARPSVFLHPAPALLTATAALAWWGVAS